ncbi:hypothetical protein CfE428DRAFT_5824 [Chthoniobacter flavus Ellin428]|uniref:Uncharacterized protein n=1 Tax=Chthoniobacter flavus Ellin428 TaxID=497964 RepID=B4DA84_9BACT|nr:hypothetical protein [Chthoniobacter flavus]EDY16711.1 hypothetical protein CfE428DRAFT_5824 [Chthoniobacter flavus Ellin428]TCO87277.1 hypothetical protein EV701_123114 [Chthoniobacter flavus]
MSVIGNRHDHGPHADYRAAVAEHGHSGSFNDVNAACTKWLQSRGVMPSQIYYGTPLSRRGGNARRDGHQD